MADLADFDDFFRADFPLLVGFLRKQGYDPATAEESAQDAMTKALGLWADIDHPGAWVRKAALRLAAGHRRKQRTQADWSPEHHPAVDGEFTGFEERELTVQLLNGLPPAQRKVMAWHLDGYSPDEIAVQLQQRASTVRSNLRHARRRLERLYAERRAQ